MNIITHALLPIIGIEVLQRRQIIHANAYWNRKKVFLVGFFAALPDLINPHFSLQERYTSWSHGIPAFVAIIILLFIIKQLANNKIDTKLILWLSGAYLFHIFCDMISGGIGWLAPFHSYSIGGYYVSPLWWFHIDFICVFIAYGLYRITLTFIKRKQQ